MIRVHRIRARRGLTLIELIVVLLILVGLAGILIPMLPNMLGRTHTASGATNIQEVNKWVQTFEQLNFRYPSSFDALNDTTTASNIPDYIPGNASADLSPLTLTAAHADALEAAGITAVAPMYKDKAALGTNSPTFDPYSGVDVSVAAGLELVQLNAAGKLKLNLSTTGTYVVLGLGKRCEMIGRVVAEAPVHFSDSPDNGPADVYGRYGLVFKVADTAADVERAFLVGVVAFHDDGIATGGEHLEEFYNIVKSSK